MTAIGDSFFLFEIQKLKRALRKLDDKEAISTKIISEIIESSALKLEKGGYVGTAEDLRILADAVNTGFTGVSITPTSSPTGTGVASWIATQNGTYTNFGGFVVPANHFAIFSRDANGVFSVSMTALDITSKVNVSDVKNDLVSTDVNKPLSANQGKVLNENKADLVVGKNKFNYNDTDVKRGFFLNASGVPTPFSVGYDLFSLSGFIPVTAGQVLKINQVNHGNVYHCFYNIGKAFISGSNTLSNTVTAPVGAVYVRFTLRISSAADIAAAKFQVELGTVSTAYEEYKLIVTPNQLSLIDYTKTADLPAIINPLLSSKADLVVGKNKFNYLDSDVKRGFHLNSSGVVTVFYSGFDLFSVSGFIKVTAGQILKISQVNHTNVYNCFYDVNKNFISGSNTLSNTVTAPSNAVYVRFTLIISSTADISTANFQVELGTTSTTYEAYGLKVAANQLNLTGYSKIVDLPSVINPYITSKADLVVGKNLFNKNAVGIIDGKILDATNGLITNASYYVSDYMPITPSTAYIHANFAVGGAYCVIYDSNKTFISSFQTATVTTPANGYFIRMSGTIANKSIQQFEAGTVATAYEAYGLRVTPTQLTDYAKITDLPSVVAPLVATKADLVVGKNLFNKNALGILDGKYIGTSGFLQTNASYFVSDYIAVLPSTTYVHSNFALGGALCAIYDANKTYISTFNSTSIAIPSNGYFVRMSGSVANKSIQQFELGSTSTSYEAYGFKVTPSQLPAQITYSNKIACPLKQHFLTTIENNIYLAEFQKRFLPNFILDTKPNVGLRKNDIIRATNPTAGSYSVTNALVDLDYSDVMRKNYTAVVTDLSKTTAINVLSVGDSYTDIGSYVKKMGQTIPNINHVGMCKTLAGTDVKREGRSGWTLAQYMTQTGSTALTGFFSPFLHPVAPYTYYGNTDFWKKVFVGTAPSYEIDTFKPWLTTLNINSSGVKATPTVNDVMYFTVDSAYKYWDGSAWTVISSATLGFTFNFAKYLTTWSVPTPDVITVLLGMNDFRSISPTAFDSFFIGWKANLDAFITNVKLANTNVKIVIATCNSTEYNDLSGKANATLWEGYNSVINAYDNREAEKIYISDTKASVDRVLGFSGTRAIPFSNYTGSETIWYTQGDVHLNTGGMNQIGEKLAATIQYIR